MEQFKMKIEQHILEEAKNLLSFSEKELPVQLSNGSFWLAEASESTIIAAGTFSVDGKQYKIGFLREE